jgi:hypothetical protein
MNIKYLLIAFIAICLMQWYVLSGWIIDSEKIIHQGKYLKIRYLNPNTLQLSNRRGNYLWLNPDPNLIEFTDSAEYSLNQDIYIKYDCDQNKNCNSFQILTENTVDQPYLIKAKIQSIYPSYKNDTQKIFVANLQYSYTQFYFNSDIPSLKLDMYNRSITDSTKKYYIGVYAWKGNAIADALWVDNVKME